MPGPKLNRAFPGAALAPSPDDPSRRMTGNALAYGGPVPTPVNRLAPQPAMMPAAPSGNALAPGGVALPPPRPMPPPMPAAPRPQAPPPTNAVVGAIAASPVAQLANVAGRLGHTPREQIRLVRQMTAAIRDITELLKHPVVTDADVAAVEKKSRRSGDHEGKAIDAFLSRLPPVADQVRRRAFLEQERAALAKQIASVHIAAGDKGIDLAGLITSGARRA